MADTPRRYRTLPELWLLAQRNALRAGADAVDRARFVDDRVEESLSVSVGQTPSEVVYTENKLELLHYEPLTERQYEVPLLIVYALINRPFILDLQRDRSIVRRLLEAGHDVYLINWNEPSRLDRYLGLEDYVDRYIDNCVDVVRERSGQESINVLGYCMGGTLSTIYTALHPEKVNALALMATGLYFEDTGGVLELWGDAEHYDPRAVTETFGNVPREFLNAGFALMDPVANTVTKYVRQYEHLENEDFVKNFARMERWLAEGVDVAGAVYAEFLEEIYQRNSLYENELLVGGEHVDVRNIDMPLLQIVGEHDTLVPPAASKPFNDVVGSDDVTTIEYPTGHVGLAMSDRTHRDLWPEVAEWFAEQSGHAALADVIGEGVERALGVDVETDVTVGNADEVEIGIADEHGEIARAVVEERVETIVAFLESALEVTIALDIEADGITVTVTTDEGVERTVFRNVGEAIQAEIQESREGTDLAARYDLEDVEGIGPTYGDRLRAAGIESVADLREADTVTVAKAAKASRKLARNWIAGARELARSPGE